MCEKYFLHSLGTLFIFQQKLNSHEYKYKIENEHSNKFLILKYLKLFMIDTKDVLDQICENFVFGYIFIYHDFMCYFMTILLWLIEI